MVIGFCFSVGATSQAVNGESLSQELHGLNALLLELQSIQSTLSAELPVCYVLCSVDMS